MIAATFHGAHYAPPNYDFDTIEVFPSLEDAIDALFDRYASNGRRLIDSRFLDGSGQSVFWPTVEIGDSFKCYRVPGFRDVEIGEGERLEVHTAVHGGWWDYEITLASAGDNDDVAVTVTKVGI
ncbi:hypothetical protein PP641_gp093 [Arthrobacter phage SilentRX]|uniref:Uncharacterized protein n=1 Tax=Arthrobacter phage SilentRX TaxID=2836091 RepID=A0A8F3E7M7_9CAUD|nr:hypothetical protein PP641_gp093 [Arthrobacter phage SilentRX]QWY82833.1 hypothetical protein SEA_SILENTRX_93 [Arthrobacter phage SilentRX]